MLSGIFNWLKYSTGVNLWRKFSRRSFEAMPIRDRVQRPKSEKLVSLPWRCISSREIPLA